MDTSVTVSNGLLPFSGTSIFLHIRANDTKNDLHSARPQRTVTAVRKECKTYIQQLGGSLALSDGTAQLIVFHNGCSAFLKSCLGAGKVVVTPSYLRDCVVEQKRLPLAPHYLPTPAPSELSKTTFVAASASSGSRSAQSPIAANREDSPSDGSPTLDSSTSKRAAISNIRSIAYLLDDENSGEEPTQKKRATPLNRSSSVGTSGTGAAVVAARLQRPPIGRNTVPYLAEVDEESFEPTTLPFPRRMAHLLDDDTSTLSQPMSRCVKNTPAIKSTEAAGLAAPLAWACEDELRHAVLRAAAQPRRPQCASATASEGVGTKRGRFSDPFLDSDEWVGNGVNSPRGEEAAVSPVSSGNLMGEEVTQRLPPDAQGAVPRVETPLSTPPLAAVDVSALGLHSSNGPLWKERTSSPFSTTKSRRARERAETPTNAAAKRLKPSPAGDPTTRPASPREESPREKPKPKKKTDAHLHNDKNNNKDPKDSNKKEKATANEKEAKLKKKRQPPLPRGLCVAVSSERAAVRVGVVVRDSNTSAFFSDVLVQLGAVVIPDWGVEKYRQRAPCPTHLLVDKDAELTPSILLAKALGLPILTPQWVDDAVLLSALPEIRPEAHHHPVFGIETKEFHPNGALRKEESAPSGSSPTSSALAFLRKEVREARMLVGQRQERPYYEPIFHDLQFYIEMGAGDCQTASSSVKKRKQPQKPRGEEASLTPAEVFELVTMLIHVLGGTITRNRESPYLDVVVDLAGGAVEAAAQCNGKKSAGSNGAKSAVDASCDALSPQHVFSLSGWEKEGGGRPFLSFPSAQAAETPEKALQMEPQKTGGPAVVGLSWLIYSILRRQRADPHYFLGGFSSSQPAASYGEGRTHDFAWWPSQKVGDDNPLQGVDLLKSETCMPCGSPSTQEATALFLTLLPHGGAYSKTKSSATSACKQAAYQLHAGS